MVAYFTNEYSNPGMAVFRLIAEAVEIYSQNL